MRPFGVGAHGGQGEGLVTRRPTRAYLVGIELGLRVDCGPLDAGSARVQLDVVNVRSTQAWVPAGAITAGRRIPDPLGKRGPEPAGGPEYAGTNTAGLRPPNAGAFIGDEP